jgi:hypothetical protein
MPAGSLVPAAATLPGATPVVVDTDLGADDLAALALLLRTPSVRVEAITIADTGLVRCRAGVDVLEDLLTALDEPPVPVACGREHRGPKGRPMPTAWRYGAEAGSGLTREPDSTLQPDDRPAADLLAELSSSISGLEVVALGPATNLADLATAVPEAYRRLAAVHIMGGVVEGEGQEGVGEWNVAADPESFQVLLDTAGLDTAGPEVTIVPADAVPAGTPKALAAPVLGQVTVKAMVPAWWDLAAAGAYVDPRAVTGSESGRYTLDGAEPGRLQRSGEGPVTVVRKLDEAALEQVYGAALAYELVLFAVSERPAGPACGCVGVNPSWRKSLTTRARRARPGRRRWTRSPRRSPVWPPSCSRTSRHWSSGPGAVSAPAPVW